MSSVVALRPDPPDERVALEAQVRFDKLVHGMETILARYGSRVVLADLETHLLPALDHALGAKSDGELQARPDTLRVLHATMLRHEQHAKEWGLNLPEIAPLEVPKSGGGEAEGAAQRQAEPLRRGARFAALPSARKPPRQARNERRPVTDYEELLCAFSSAAFAKPPRDPSAAAGPESKGGLPDAHDG
jgi:hypothetical protein